MELSSLKIDSAKINAGDWVADIPGLGDVRLKVRGLDNPDYRRRRSELVGALPPSKRSDPEAVDGITTQLVVETILLDWTGLTDGGKAIAYSRERAAEILADPDAKPLLDAIVWAAGQVGAIREEAVQSDAGKP